MKCQHTIVFFGILNSNTPHGLLDCIIFIQINQKHNLVVVLSHNDYEIETRKWVLLRNLKSGYSYTIRKLLACAPLEWPVFVIVFRVSLLLP